MTLQYIHWGHVIHLTSVPITFYWLRSLKSLQRVFGHLYTKFRHFILIGTKLRFYQKRYAILENFVIFQSVSTKCIGHKHYEVAILQAIVPHANVKKITQNFA